jgi:hypothetical protein
MYTSCKFISCKKLLYSVGLLPCGRPYFSSPRPLRSVRAHHDFACANFFFRPRPLQYCPRSFKFHPTPFSILFAPVTILPAPVYIQPTLVYIPSVLVYILSVPVYIPSAPVPYFLEQDLFTSTPAAQTSAPGEHI